MLLWWIGNVVLLFVVAPVVIILANRLLRPAMEILDYSNDIVEHGFALARTLDALPAFERTRQLAAQANQGVARYGGAVQRLM